VIRLAECKRATDRAQCVTDSVAKAFNNFERTIDRKYALYETFGFLRPEFGFKVEKYHGSNQVILYDEKGTELYNSDREGKLGNPQDFRTFFKSQLESLLGKQK